MKVEPRVDGGEAVKEEPHDDGGDTVQEEPRDDGDDAVEETTPWRRRRRGGRAAER